MKILPFEIPTRYIKASGLTIALLAALATSAEAKDARTHAFARKTFGGKPVDRNFALANDSTTESMVVVCPIADTSALRKEEIKLLNVHVTNNTFGANALPAMACYSAWWTGGGNCGSLDIATHPGNATLTIPLNVWNSSHRADFGYSG